MRKVLFFITTKIINLASGHALVALADENKSFQLFLCQSSVITTALCLFDLMTTNYGTTEKRGHFNSHLPKIIIISNFEKGRNRFYLNLLFILKHKVGSKQNIF